MNTPMDAADLALFEAQRPRLQAAAFRMLGSMAEAQDAVQEAWLRYHRADRSALLNPSAWLLTVIGRICLDLLRARAAKPESPAAPDLLAAIAPAGDPGTDPAAEAELVESVGRAMLVVLARLSPAERIAFVLHDAFAVPFQEIAPVLGRTPATTKKLASRARTRIYGEPEGPEPVDRAWHREVVAAFLAAARGRDLAGLLEVLDPDVVRVADPAAVPAGARLSIRGARAVAEETVLLWRNTRYAGLALVDGEVGLVVAPHGKLRAALRIRCAHGRIAGYQVVAEPSALDAVELAVLEP